MIEIALRCDYPLCMEERFILPSTGPYADLEVWVCGEDFGVESSALDKPAGWSITDLGRCRCPKHAGAALPEPPTEGESA